MFTREEYDEKIDKLKNQLGDSFALVSDVVAELSTDYDAVLLADSNSKKELENLKTTHEAEINKMKEEKMKILEANNELFTKVRNNVQLPEDPVVKEEAQKYPTDINNIINENGGLE